MVLHSCERRDQTFYSRAADSRSEWMKPNSTGLANAIRQADSLFAGVKQTSDATIDSRLLVSAGDLTYKKTNEMVFGDSTVGIDVDEFVSKCITFMRNGPVTRYEGALTATQGGRRRRTAGDDEDVEDDEGDALNWEHLGAHACFPSNLRPAVPGFLLGPLSVQKRARTQKPRRTAEQRKAPTEVTRPEELQAEDIEHNENSNLTNICRNIRTRLSDITTAGRKAVEQLNEDTTEEEYLECIRKNKLEDDGNVSLLKFALNPRSFGQTVENLFYVSFLIREGSVSIGKDSNGLPTLGESVGSQPVRT